MLSYDSTVTGSIPRPTTPGVALSRTFTAAPFSGTGVGAHDLEGSAYVPADDALWLSDDNWDRVYEVDATTSILRRSIERTEFADARPPGGGGSPAGLTRADDFESLAYDATNDTLYLFSGNCCGVAPYDPTVFRLLRGADGRFQVDSYRALPEGTDPTGAGWRPGVGLYLAHGGRVTSYNFATNVLGTPVPVNAPGGIEGMTYTVDGQYIIAVTAAQRLAVIDAATMAVLPGWSIDLAPFGVLDARAVEYIDGQLFVTDGDDFRPPGDPLQYATFVFDLVEGPPNAAFTATPTGGSAPLAVQFTDATFGTVTSRIWLFGDGTSSTATNPSHTYTTVGQYTASLMVSNAHGSTTATQVISVVVPPVTVTAAADSYVRSNAANSNYGTASTLARYQSFGTTYQPFVRFSVNALPAAPASAKLRLYVTDSSTSTGTLFQTANATWTETGITWNNRPATSGVQVAPAQNAPQNQWVEFDVTPVVTGTGQYSFTLTGAINDLLQFSSRQGANAPQLVISFG